MPETYDGITSPDSEDEFKPIQDLAGMAESIQEALYRRANTYKGTSAQRQSFTSEAPEGVLWKDTNGARALFTKWGGGWQQIWPDTRNTLQIGSRTQPVSAQLQVLRYFPNSGNWSHVNYTSATTNEDYGFSIVNWFNNEATSSLSMAHSGRLATLTYADGITRTLPFGIRSGRASRSDDVPGNGGQVTIPFTFPANYFTEAPSVLLTASSGRLTPVATQVTRSGFNAIFWNYTSAPLTAGWTLNWLAIQP